MSKKPEIVAEWFGDGWGDWRLVAKYSVSSSHDFIDRFVLESLETDAMLEPTWVEKSKGTDVRHAMRALGVSISEETIKWYGKGGKSDNACSCGSSCQCKEVSKGSPIEEPIEVEEPRQVICSAANVSTYCEKHYCPHRIVHAAMNSCKEACGAMEDSRGLETECIPIEAVDSQKGEAK